MSGLAVLYGTIVGFALGLTGGGGGIFAVPLLVFGLSLTPREAVGISLASVGGTSLFGVIPRWQQGLIEVRIGIIFAIAGIVGAPVGTWLSARIAGNTLLILFSVLMLLIAWQMWARANTTRTAARGKPSPPLASFASHSVCGRNDEGQPILRPSCIALLSATGLLTGVLSGLFGVGGGFVIVPALVIFSGMPTHTAVATSLMIIFLVSISGVGSYVIGGGELSIRLTAAFIGGGFIGMNLGSALSKRLSEAALQRTFAVATLAVASFVVIRSLVRA